MIDVGWGDSIFIESQDNNGDWHYGLIDSNDTTTLRSSHIFLKRHFERDRVRIAQQKPIFEFVMLTHAHSDHSVGLKALMREFGTEHFWYTKSKKLNAFTDLLKYSNRSDNVGAHQAVDSDHILPDFGDVKMKLLWPENDEDKISRNENNNSAVLSLTLDDVSIVLTGDAEAEVWNAVAHDIPANTHFFKVPHHGSRNGTFEPNTDDPVWITQCPDKATLGISSHAMRFGHPHHEVVKLFKDNDRDILRTDEHYHITIETDGANVTKKYSH
jgi:competence protein ComEC